MSRAEDLYNFERVLAQRIIAMAQSGAPVTYVHGDTGLPIAAVILTPEQYLDLCERADMEESEALDHEHFEPELLEDEEQE